MTCMFITDAKLVLSSIYFKDQLLHENINCKGDVLLRREISLKIICEKVKNSKTVMFTFFL